MRSGIEAILALTGLAAGCADRPADAAGGARSNREESRMEQGANGGEGVRDLPSSFGRSFATLDEYLEHLRRHAGPIDQPWYREVRPGVYEYVTTMRSEDPSAAPRTFTREELMRQFGFTR
ncbi:MAG TPA: hypothetical protein VFQ67_10185 [Allosphingosinicella sp.]|nr:hypothetical protein [Allosphingosinicella sp.]